MISIRAATNLFSRILTITIFITLLLIPIHVGATDLRGRIDGQHTYSPYPFPVNGARVDLYIWDGSWKLVYTTFSGPDGMYYMQNIRPNNNYYLQVNRSLNYPLTVNNTPYQDIPPILIRY